MLSQFPKTPFTDNWRSFRVRRDARTIRHAPGRLIHHWRLWSVRHGGTSTMTSLPRNGWRRSHVDNVSWQEEPIYVGSIHWS